MLALGFVLILVLNAFVLKLASDLLENTFAVDNFGWALLAALLVAAVSIVLEVIFGTNDDDTYTLRVVQRIARRQGGASTNGRARASSSSRSTGSRFPCSGRAMRDGNATNMARWIAEGSHRPDRVGDRPLLADGREPGGDPARLQRRHPRVPLGRQGDRPAHGVLRSRRLRSHRGRSRHRHRPARRRRLEPRQPALGRGRGGHPHRQPHGGRAEARTPAIERSSRTGSTSRASLVLFALGGHPRVDRGAPGDPSRRPTARSPRRRLSVPARRDVRVVRDLIVYGVLTDMMRGRPAVYATFSSYDEVAHHSGLERADTLEALRKLDEQFGRIDRARRYAPRPYEIVVLSDHGQTQGATFKQRNGYGLDELVERSLEHGTVDGGRRRRRAAVDGRARGRRGDQRRGARREGQGQAREERRLGPRGRRARLGEPRPHLADGGAAPAHARGDQRAPSAADPGAP